MFLEKITWKQAEGYFKEKDIAIIPVGSTENHGSQLCLGTDFLIPRRLCEMMDDRLNILIAPSTLISPAPSPLATTGFTI